MHLIALVEAPDHVCCRYRLAAFQPYLEAAGHTLELRPLPRGFWERLHLGSDLGHADAVILQRKLLSNWQCYLLRRRVRRLIFDFDDAVWLRDSYATRGFVSLRRLNRFRSTVRICDAITAGNRFLADQAHTWADSADIRIIPTCVNDTIYPTAQHTRQGPDTQLVWIGSSSTLRGLEMTGPLLETIGQAVPGLTLKIICDRFPTFEHLRILPCEWRSDSERIELANADIGISWVPDDPWSRGKCGLKVLQYMAAGLPVVANPVGVQTEMIRHGETGFLVSTPAEWIDAIRRLSADANLRQRMGEAGRKLLEADYSIRAGAEGWLRLLRSFQEQRRSA